jgi:hypothetical protein
MAESTTRTPTHYDLLGVRPTASPQQIRRAFRDLSKLYHPDTTELPPAEATEKFQQLNEAYAILSSPDRRWSYDKQVGYSRISVMQPLEPLSRRQTTPRRKEVSNVYLDPNDRPLSAGEIFALFILGMTFVACLVLVLTIGLTQGETTLSADPAIAPLSQDIVLPQEAQPETLPLAELDAAFDAGVKTQRPANDSAEGVQPVPKPESGIGADGQASPSSPDGGNSQAGAKKTVAPPAQPTWL